MNGITNAEEKHSKLFAWEKIENDLITAEKSIREEGTVSGRNLPPLHVHRVIFLIDQIRHLHKLIPFALERGDERIQRLGGVLRTVVAEDDGTVTQVLVVADGIHIGVYTVVLPIQTVPVRYRWN